MTASCIRIEVVPKAGFPDSLARKAAQQLEVPASAVSGARVYYLEVGDLAALSAAPSSAVPSMAAPSVSPHSATVAVAVPVMAGNSGDSGERGASKATYPLSVPASWSETQIRELALAYLADPISDEVRVGEVPSATWAIEVAFRLGVTDNEGNVAGEILTEVLGRRVRVHSARRFDIEPAALSAAQAQLAEYCSKRLGNPVVERFRVVGVEPPFSFDRPEPPVQEAGAPAGLPAGVEVVPLPADPVALAELSSRRLLALSMLEMEAVRAYFADPAIQAERTEAGLPAGAPTDAELEAIAQTWSEHCKHKVFNDRIVLKSGDRTETLENGLFKTYIRAATEAIGGEFLVSVFTDNAGVVRFDDRHHMVFKVETHNSPSAIEPYGGALTGIVGVNRDPAGTGLGCKLLFNTDVFCVGPQNWSHPLPRGVLPPARILAGIRKGVEDGGNQSGIPTVDGAVYFDERFLARPLVFCGTGGLMPAEFAGQPAHLKHIEPGDLIVMVGGRVGRDGIHGATFSSEGVFRKSGAPGHEGGQAAEKSPGSTTHTETPGSVVQIGDPITQKRALDFLTEARHQGLYRAITDNGAGGLSSSVGELALLSGGCEIHLQEVPLKAIGLLPWEILVSESQERMTLAVPPERWAELAELAARRGVEATAIGRFTASGRYVAKVGDREVVRLDLHWLHEAGLPRRTLEAEWNSSTRGLAGKGSGHADSTAQAGQAQGDSRDLTSALLALLRSPNICSREGLVRQYDHEVQGGSVVKPLVGVKGAGPSDAAVLRPLLDSNRAIAVSSGLGCAYGDFDPYWMAVDAVDEAVRNAVCVGADPSRLAILDNFCWPDPVYEPQRNPDGKRKLGALVRACQGLYDAAIAYGAPLISGKDSVKNDFMGKRPEGPLGVEPASLGPGAADDDLKLSAPPTLLVSAIAVVPEATRAVTMDFKASGDLLYLLGETRPELAGSEYLKLQGRGRADLMFQDPAQAGFSAVPTVDPAVARRCYEAVHRAMQEDLVASCHDASEGGLAVAIAECALAGELGVRCDVSALLGPAPGEAASQGTLIGEVALFSESAGRLLLTVAPSDRERFESHFVGLPLSCIGQVMAPDPSGNATMEVAAGGRVLLSAAVEHLKRAWQETPQW